MWLMFSIELYMRVDLGFLGILPRTLSGFIGVFTAPLIHGDLNHLIANTTPLLFVGSAIFLFYPRVAIMVFLYAYFFTNILVWIFGRDFYHIGASGLIYALAFFLIFSGLFKRNLIALTLSLVVLIVYNGLFNGLLPTNTQVSWESHLFGAVVGGCSAFIFRKTANS